MLVKTMNYIKIQSFIKIVKKVFNDGRSLILIMLRRLCDIEFQGMALKFVQDFLRQKCLHFCTNSKKMARSIV